ncbi:hypothetical protein ACLK11_11045 [Escherichia coli]
MSSPNWMSHGIKIIHCYLALPKEQIRKAGLETLFFEPEGEGFSLPPDSPALHVIQHIRDESHDHAIGGHRKKKGEGQKYQFPGNH